MRAVHLRKLAENPNEHGEGALAVERAERLIDAVRAVDEDIFGPETAADVNSDDYARKLFAIGVRVSGPLWECNHGPCGSSLDAADARKHCCEQGNHCPRDGRFCHLCGAANDYTGRSVGG